MSESLHLESRDLAGSIFRHVNLSHATFEDVNLSGARFFNANLRGASIGAVDFGGASLSCLNTGEDRPKTPAHFKHLELDDCTFEECCFQGVRLIRCDVRGVIVNGVPLADLLKAYHDAKAPSATAPNLESTKPQE